MLIKHRKETYGANHLIEINSLFSTLES